MRILLDQVAHDMRNKGNNALLQAAIDRLLIHWPKVDLDLITVAPNLAKSYFPMIQPVDPYTLHPIRSRFHNFSGHVPRSILRLILELREWYLHRRAGDVRQKIQQEIDSQNLESQFISLGKYNHEGSDGSNVSENSIQNLDFQTEIAKYDLVIATGGGYMCDHDKWSLLDMFNRFEAAIQQNIPTVITGVGVGPLEDQELIASAKTILPKVDLILFRNRRLGSPLLESLGVPAEKRMVTGDDAVEIAHRARQNALGSSLGVSLRVSSYTQIQIEQLDTLRLVLHKLARKFDTKLIAIPISSASHESDITQIKYVLDGFDRITIDQRKLNDHMHSIEQAGQCRVVVTGTYHGAIFSLAQGIPVVGVAKSEEYYNKLAELSDEFGPGCSVISLDDDNLKNNLIRVIEETWNSAEELRPLLIKASSRQIELQHLGYKRIYDLINGLDSGKIDPRK